MNPETHQGFNLASPPNLIWGTNLGRFCRAFQLLVYKNIIVSSPLENHFFRNQANMAISGRWRVARWIVYKLKKKFFKFNVSPFPPHILCGREEPGTPGVKSPLSILVCNKQTCLYQAPKTSPCKGLVYKVSTLKANT